MSFLKWLLSRSFMRAFETSELRHMATLASGFALGWLGQQGFLQGDAAQVAEGIGAIIMGLGGYGLSKLNASGQKAVAQVAAQTGQVLTAAQAKAVLASNMHTAADTKTSEQNQRIVDDVKTQAAAQPGAAAPVVSAAIADELRDIK